MGIRVSDELRNYNYQDEYIYINYNDKNKYDSNHRGNCDKINIWMHRKNKIKVATKRVGYLRLRLQLQRSEYEEHGEVPLPNELQWTRVRSSDSGFNYHLQCFLIWLCSFTFFYLFIYFAFSAFRIELLGPKRAAQLFGHSWKLGLLRTVIMMMKRNAILSPKRRWKEKQ